MALGRLGDPADGRCVLVEAIDDATARPRRCSRSALGRPRSLARPDAPRPRRPTTASWSSWSPSSCSAAPAARRRPGLAQLRRLPRGLRGGRADRRRADPAAVAARCCCSSPAGGSWSRCTGPTSSTSRSGHRASCASGTPRAGPGRSRVGDRRGLRGRSPARRRAAGRAAGRGRAAVARLGRRRGAAGRPRGGGRERPGADAGTAGQARPDQARPGSSRTRSTTPAPTCAARSTSGAADLAPDSRTGETVGIAGRVMLLPRPRRPALRDPARLERRPAGHARQRHPTSGRPPSTSATTSA